MGYYEKQPLHYYDIEEKKDESIPLVTKSHTEKEERHLQFQKEGIISLAELEQEYKRYVAQRNV